MNFASYARKSIFSDKSDSTKNQERMSREYADFHFRGKIDSFNIYEDEDFTGANTNRPELTRLINDINSGLIDVLIVYQLDRLTRNVRDFANMYATLEEKGVQFISVKENIDTTTPIGRAMMYVIVVFAQMERETIADRVTDNMVGLAKQGFWTGGNPPLGYMRNRVTVNGKSHVILEVVLEDANYVHGIYDIFIENKFSLRKMEAHFKNNNILTKNGNFFSSNQLYQILSMSTCVESKPEIYDFYAAKGCIMDTDSPREKWDGAHGLIVYGRTTERNKKHEINPPDKWRVCLGRHKPYMSADKWLCAQSQFLSNTFSKTMKYDIPLLKGALRCSCGRLMSVSRKKKARGGVSSWYYCPKRMRQGVEYCQSVQTNIDLLDNEVIRIFNEICHDPAAIEKYVKVSNIDKDSVFETKHLLNKISSTEAKIDRLAVNLSINESSSASKYIVKEIEKLDLTLNALRHNLADSRSNDLCRKNITRDIAQKRQDIIQFMNDFDELGAYERNEISCGIIQECSWDGVELSLTL